MGYNYTLVLIPSRVVKIIIPSHRIWGRVWRRKIFISFIRWPMRLLRRFCSKARNQPSSWTLRGIWPWCGPILSILCEGLMYDYLIAKMSLYGIWIQPVVIIPRLCTFLSVLSISIGFKVVVTHAVEVELSGEKQIIWVGYDRKQSSHLGYPLETPFWGAGLVLHVQGQYGMCVSSFSRVSLQ